MLSKPEYGWTDISIDEKECFPASYITDVPYDCLEDMIRALNEYKDFCVSFDAEGYTFKVIIDEYQTIILLDDEYEEVDGKNIGKCYIYEKSKLTLAKELLSDIKAFADDWFIFPTDESFTMEEINYTNKKEEKTNEDIAFIERNEKKLEERKVYFNKLLSDLEEAINRREE